MADYAFFLSYARVDGGRHLERFFDDLATAVRREVPLPSGTPLREIGFYDSGSIDVGELWDDALVDGLQTARTFVAILSPGYLGSAGCGRELAVFLARLHAGRAEEKRRALLLPIMWDRPTRIEVPPALARYQRTHADLGGTYASHGLRHLVERADCDPQYSEFVDELAGRLAEAARSAAVPGLDPPPRWETTRNAFVGAEQQSWGPPPGGRPVEDRSITRDFTDDERADIPKHLVDSFDGKLTLKQEEPIHAGEFALVYSGYLDEEHVAIKVVPTTALRKRVRRTLEVAEEARKKLRDTSFVHVAKVVRDPEFEAVVMEFAEWPTLRDKLAGHQGRLDPGAVTALLARISHAQSEAHKRGVPLGALSPWSIFVDDQDGEVRLSPFRIEAHLAGGLTLGDDQVVSRDVLEMLTPEIYEGKPPVTRQELDAHGQYYLGLLGLELLLGRRPVNISCLKDLSAKEAFFDDPRRHFEPAGCVRWTDEAPALAFVLAKLLARQPAQRMESAEAVSDELRQIVNGHLPYVVRQCIGADYATTTERRTGFTERFYRRLFAARPRLAAMFSRSAAEQAMHLATAIQDLIEFPENRHAPRFRQLVRAHAGMGITKDDADAFRQAFVAEVIESSDPSSSNISPQMHGDAWNAALELGIGTLLGHLDEAEGSPFRNRGPEKALETGA